MDTKLVIINFFFFGMRFSGVTISLVPPVKSVYTVSDEKAYRYL